MLRKRLSIRPEKKRKRLRQLLRSSPQNHPDPPLHRDHRLPIMLLPLQAVRPLPPDRLPGREAVPRHLLTVVHMVVRRPLIPAVLPEAVLRRPAAAPAAAAVLFLPAQIPEADLLQPDRARGPVPLRPDRARGAAHLRPDRAPEADLPPREAVLPPPVLPEAVLRRPADHLRVPDRVPAVPETAVLATV